MNERRDGRRGKAAGKRQDELHLFTALMDSTLDFIYFKDLEGRFTRINRAMASRLGLTHPDEALGKTDSDFFGADHARRALEDEREVLRSGRPLISKREKVVWPDGVETWVSTTKLPLYDGKGGLVGTFGISRDVTERRQVEEVLKAEKERGDLYLNTAEVILVALDTDARITLLNRKGCQVLGCREGELIGQDWFRTSLRPEDCESVRAVHQRIIAGEIEPFEYHENYVVTRQGQERRIAWHNALIRDEQNRITGVLSSGEDVTERKQAEAERHRMEARMLQVQKLESLGVLAGGIAHDFNNLLTVILANLDLALADVSPLSPTRDALRDAENAARRSADLCRQMLAYAGKGRFVLQRLSLRELVEGMSHMLEASVSKKAVLRYSLAANAPAVEADATQIRQILMNLVINASEAIDDCEGSISVATGVMECDRRYLAGTSADDELQEGAYVYLEVTDTGCGMDEATKGRIFDPFFTTKFAGRGLGLPAVLGIVRSHRGAIKVRSEPGAGTTFRILLPATSQPAESLAEATDVEAWQGTGTVLLADDEEAIRAVAKRMLERMGFRVLLAADGVEAVELFRKAETERGERVACVILDLSMPRMDGEEALRELRRIRLDVPVVLSSGYSEQQATEKFVGKGLAGFIQKPYQARELAANLRTALGV